jgi:hypothetical protein
LSTTSRAQVRFAVAQFFGGTNYDSLSRAYRGNGPLFSSGLSTVRAYRSKRLSDEEYVLGQAAGRGMGAYMIVEMPSSIEIRRTLPAVTGRKRKTYTVNLHTYHLAYQDHAEDAEADCDALSEAIEDLIHADVTLGTATSSGAMIYQAGESHMGIRTAILPSATIKEKTKTYIRISFEAEVEIVA